MSICRLSRFDGSYDELDLVTQHAVAQCGLSTPEGIADLSPASPMQECVIAAEALRQAC